MRKMNEAERMKIVSAAALAFSDAIREVAGAEMQVYGHDMLHLILCLTATLLSTMLDGTSLDKKARDRTAHDFCLNLAVAMKRENGGV